MPSNRRPAPSKAKSSSSAKAKGRPASRNGSTGRDSDRQAELLAIAARMFATRGFRGTTVRDIADEAGILSGSLYHHFDSKESLVDAILRSFLDGMLADYRAILEEGRPPRATLERLVHASLAAMADNRSAIIIYQDEMRRFSELPRFAYLREATLEFRNIWIGVLEDGIRQGDFRKTIDKVLVYRLIRDAVWNAPRWFRPEAGMTLDRLADEYLGVLLDGIATERA